MAVKKSFYQWCIENDRQDLLKEWDTLNNNKLGKTIHNVSSGSSAFKLHWICKEGHRFQQIAYNRTRNTQGCPYCSNIKIKSGINDLKTYCLYNNREDILKEWDYEKNETIGLHIDTVSRGTIKKAYWKCENGHSWYAGINSRVGGHRGCPYCNTEHTSMPEQFIYHYIKYVLSTIDIRNRYKIGGYEFDITIGKPYLTLIEYNGSRYHNSNDRDREKREFCEKHGINFIVINDNLSNSDIFYDEEHNTYYINYRQACRDIKLYVKLCNKIIDQIGAKTELEVTEEVIDKIRVEATRYAKKHEIDKEISIAVKCPDSLVEWNYEKNGGISPYNVTYGSHRKYWMTCKTCNEDYLISALKYSQGNRCRECGIKRRNLINSKFLINTHPIVAKEYSSKNEVHISKITHSFKKSVIWECLACGREYNYSVLRKVHYKIGCKYCGFNAFKEEEN